MEAVSVAKHIEAVIDAIKVEGKLSKDLIEAKANAAKNYDKAVATRSLIHKADGMAVTMVEKQAKGDAHELLYDKIVAEDTLKAHFKRLDYLMAQQNGYQSIFSKLSHT